MKTQYRDPLGILNSLQHVAGSPFLFSYLLEAAESFDVCMIRRNQYLTARQKDLLLSKATEPLSLLQLCRLSLRQNLRSTMPDFTRQLGIPKILEHYLTYNVI